VIDRPRSRLVVLSDSDPVARALGARWGTPPATGASVEGSAVRRLEEDLLVLRRPGPHLQEDRLDLRLPPAVLETRPTLVFPSVHRSESGTRCFAVHPLGNPGPEAPLGGRPRTLVPTDPREMIAVLRRLAADAPGLGTTATYEATHHGPELAIPAYFAEIAVSERGTPSPEEVALLDAALRSAVPDSRDRVALAVGGGHYAPRFTDLAISRRWAFGHILSRHALADLAPETARAAWEGSVGAEGILFARGQDRGHAAFAGLGPELREADAPRRDGDATSRSLPTSGT
jgi:D-tyrosyl-tRNA(Tyr) deacylase